MNVIKNCHAVVFDAYGTLFDVAAPARAILCDRADALSQAWRRKQLEYSWLRSLVGRPTARIASLSKLPALLGVSS